MSEPTPPDKIVFRSDMQTASQKPADYFAEQNKQRAEKKAKQKKQVKLALWIGIPIILILVVGLVVWLVVVSKTISEPENTTPLPVAPVTITNGSTKEVTAIQEQAQEIYNMDPSADLANPSSENLTVVDKLFTEVQNSIGGQEYPNQVLLARLMFYVENSYYEQARELLDRISPEQLEKEQQALYYNYAGTVYSSFDENEKADESYKEATKIRFELGGFGG